MSSIFSRFAAAAALVAVSACNLQAGPAVEDKDLHSGLSGMWMGACNNGLRKSFTANGNQSVLTAVNYRSGDCTGTVAYRIDRQTSFTVESTAIPLMPSAFKLDMVAVSSTMTLLDNDYVSSANGTNLCSLSNWALGVAQSIAGLTGYCTGTSITSDMQPAIGAQLYDIYEIDVATTATTLRFGQGGAGTSDAARPTALTSPADSFQQQH